MSKDHPEDPKDPRGDRVPGFTYAWMIPYLTRVARRHGYALGVHGSMSRDLDLIAVPWVEDASEPDELIEELAKLTDGKVQTKGDSKEWNVGNKPHGRAAYTIVYNGAWHFLDISVLPKVNPLRDSLGG
jgi:hypothetical protein